MIAFVTVAVGVTVAVAQNTESVSECDPDNVVYRGQLGRSFIQDGVSVSEVTRPVFIQCDTELIALTGFQESEFRFKFVGEVRIVELGDTLYADTVVYFTDTQVGEASGNVLITDGRVVLTAPDAIFYRDEKRTVFNNGVQFEDSTTVLTSRFGTYWSKEARAEFDSRVELRQDSLYVSADTLTYLRDLEETRARGHVYVERTDGELVTIFANTLFHSGLTDSSHFAGNVDMLQVSSDSTGIDSLFVKSQHLYLTQSDTTVNVVATDSVEVIQGNFSVISDTLTYIRSKDGASVLTRSYGSPVAWLDLTQITSEDLRLTRVNGLLDSLRADGNVFVAEYDSLLSRVQQLKGRTLVGLFENDSLRTMMVSPNAEALYYMEAPDEGEQKATRLSSDRIVFSFKNGELIKIGSYVDLDGEYYPANIVDQAKNLSGYRWEPERRPDNSKFREAWLRRVEQRNRHMQL